MRSISRGFMRPRSYNFLPLGTGALSASLSSPLGTPPLRPALAGCTGNCDLAPWGPGPACYAVSVMLTFWCHMRDGCRGIGMIFADRFAYFLSSSRLGCLALLESVISPRSSAKYFDCLPTFRSVLTTQPCSLMALHGRIKRLVRAGFATAERANLKAGQSIGRVRITDAGRRHS
jgi:hypothetical protein